jgi:hypothetical protein
MWQIQNPRRVFNYLHTSSSVVFEVVAVIPTSKYNSFPIASRQKIEAKVNADFLIHDVKVKDPNNPANLIEAKLITFKVNS